MICDDVGRIPATAMSIQRSKLQTGRPALWAWRHAARLQPRTLAPDIRWTSCRIVREIRATEESRVRLAVGRIPASAVSTQRDKIRAGRPALWIAPRMERGEPRTLAPDIRWTSCRIVREIRATEESRVRLAVGRIPATAVSTQRDKIRAGRPALWIAPRMERGEPRTLASDIRWTSCRIVREIRATEESPALVFEHQRSSATTHLREIRATPRRPRQ